MGGLQHLVQTVEQETQWEDEKLQSTGPPKE